MTRSAKAWSRGGFGRNGAALLLAALLACIGVLGAAAARAANPTIVQDEAQFVQDDARRPPPDTAAWQPVKLPDNWYVSRPEFSGTGWYRIRFNVSSNPPRPQVIIVKRLDANFQVLFVNGNFIGTGGPRGRMEFRVLSRPERYVIPPALLHPGTNVMHFLVEADAGLRQGLHSISVGDPVQADPEFRFQFMLQVASYNMLCAAAALSGLLALAFWLRERRQSSLLWFAITAFTWAAMYWPWFVSTSLTEFAALRNTYPFVLRFAYAAPMLVLCIRMVERSMPALEVGIWSFTLVGLATALFYGDAAWGVLLTWWRGIYLVVLLALLILLIRADRKHRDLAFWLLVTAVVAAVVVDAHDLARWLAWIDFDAPTLSPFQVPLLLFALGARVISRHFRAIDDVEHSNTELESRVAEKAREIEANHARLREVERAEALAGERQRIMTDMHDGVGGSLVGLLGAVQTGRAAPLEIERRLNEALQELRLAVDALEPVNGDLGAVLGGVRHRMRPAIEDSGVELHWRVGDLPRLGYLTPSVILQIQRIVLEALTNALRHAGARIVSVETSTDADAKALEIRIADDGSGFEAESVTMGRGMRSMRARAAGIGSELEVKTSPDGTTVILRLPMTSDALGSAV